MSSQVLDVLSSARDRDRIVIDAITAPRSTPRFAAVQELGRRLGSKARRALLTELDDPNKTVRCQAFDALIDSFGLTHLTVDTATGRPEARSPLQTLGLLVASSLEALSSRGAVLVRGLVAQLAAGKTPHELGLVYRASAASDFAERLAHAVRSGGDVPVDLIEASDGHDRAWAEAFLAIQLEREVRIGGVPTALAAIGAAWTLDALDQAREDLPDDHPFASEIGAAVAALGQAA